jgi:hypothetical protein
VVRYISHDGSKNITAAEIAAYRKVGLGIVTVFEDAAQRALAGGSAGVLDATYARSYLRGLHAPAGAGAPVYFAVDFDATGSQLATVKAYIAGAVQVLGKGATGVYGGLASVEEVAAVCKYQWQTAAWSGGRWDAGAEMDQFVSSGTTLGVQWDLDSALAADYGQWKFPGATTVATPVATSDEEDTMGQLNNGVNVQTEIAFAPGSHKSVMFVNDCGAAANAPALRIAVRSAAGGWNQIVGKEATGAESYVLGASVVTTLKFTATDAEALSISRYAQGADVAVGYTLV